MTDSTKPSAASGSDDPWEQLAEDLFGLEFGKEHAPHETQSPEVAAPAPVQASNPVVTQWAEEPEIRPEAPSASPVPAESREPAPSYAEVQVRPSTPSAQDSYWDALANWNWGEGEGSGGRGKPPEARRGEAPRSAGQRSRDEGRADRPAPAPAESPAEPRRNAPVEAAETSDFGLGVAPAASGRGPSRPAEPRRDRVPPKVEAVESDDFEDDEEDDDDSSATESGEPEAAVPGDENAPRKRRRRRRRRRSRNGNEAQGAAAPASAPAAKVPGEDWDRPSEPAAPTPRSDDRQRRPAGEGRPAAEGRTQGEGRPQSERGDDRSRGSRRRRGDRRGPPATVSAERSSLPDDDFEGESRADEVTNVGGGEVGVDFASDDEGDSGDSFVNFADVPTWEEAISYLLHPNQVQVDSNDGSDSSGDSRSGDQPRQTRHYGGRRP